MKVFITGATGYIGSAVVDALVKGEHAITALVRDREKAARLRGRGVEVVAGSLGNPETWRDAAAEQDAVVHTALESSANAPEADRLAIEAVLSLAPPVFLYTSGIWVLGEAKTPVDETAAVTSPAQTSAWRVPHERMVLDAGRETARTIVIRPGIVYGGAQGIVSDMLRDATNGIIRVIGDGTNHWPLVYDRDLGDLYARLMTAPGASGVYHATDESDDTVNDIVEALRSSLSHSPSLRHVPLAEARRKLGPYADALALDQIVRSPRARTLGWSPMLHSVSTNVPRLLEEFRRGKEAA